MKKRLCFIAFIVLALFGAGSAADVAPFYFGAAEPETHADSVRDQSYWDQLVKYKVFGTHGIQFLGQSISLSDTFGWFGTAAGDFDMSNANVHHFVGGPILIGGNLLLSDNFDTLSTGPVRITGNVVSNGSELYYDGVFRGIQCIAGSVSEQYQISKIKDPVYIDENFSECPSSVPEINTDLTIPKVSFSDKPVRSGININNDVALIDVPPGTDVFDYYVESISMSNTATLLVRMPAGGRPTRIFVRDEIAFMSHPKIQVAYMDADAEWNSKTESWASGEATTITNKDYAGNLLFYTSEDLIWPALERTDTIVGTFISAGQIQVPEHMTFAGQFVAEKVIFKGNFGGYFFVPFDPPIIKLPKVGADNLHLVEGHLSDDINIELDKASELKIDFEYCFEFAGTAVGKDPDGEAMLGDILTSIPLFNKTTQKCDNPLNGYFDIGSKSLRTPIVLTAENDGVEEGTEHFRIWIVNLSGATLEDGSHEGFMDLYIDDPELSPLKFAKDTLNGVAENTPNKTIIDTLRVAYGSKVCEVCMFSLKAESDYVSVKENGEVIVKDETLFDYETVQEIKINVHAVDGYGSFVDTVVLIPINDVNETPVIAEAVFDVDENSPKGSVVGKLEVSDPDVKNVIRFGRLEYSILDSDIPFTMDSNMIVVNDPSALDYEPNSKFVFNVKVSNCELDAATGKFTGVCLSVIAPVTVEILDVNETPVNRPPLIEAQSFDISESAAVGPVVGRVEASDPDEDLAYSTLSFSIVGISDIFEIASGSGLLYLKESLDYESKKVHKLLVRVSDGKLDDTATVVINVLNVVEMSEVEFTRFEDGDTVVIRPDTVYTKQASATIEWKQDGKTQSMIADFEPGRNVIVKSYPNPTKDIAGSDTLVVIYEVEDTPIEVVIPKEVVTPTEVVNVDTTAVSVGVGTDTDVEEPKSSSTPVVSINVEIPIDVGVNKNVANTIVEETDKGDSAIYLNQAKTEVTVSVRDPETGRKKEYAVSLDLNRRISVSQRTYDALIAVMDESVALRRVSSGVVRTIVNGSTIRVSYPEHVAGVDVTVSYMTTKDGFILMQPVIVGENRTESVEVITVSYDTEIAGRNVTISYQADAVTGEALAIDGNGNLIRRRYKPEQDVGIFRVSYDNMDASGNIAEVSYVVDKNGNFVKTPEGDEGYALALNFTDGEGNESQKSMFYVLDRTPPKVKILSPLKGDVFRGGLVDVVWTVDGVVQDTLVKQRLEMGPNAIVRTYCDKAGNVASDTVMVMAKDVYNDDYDFAEPSFRVKMVGQFQFAIVLDGLVAPMTKTYAVMDLQGRVLHQGKVRSVETVLPVLSSGSYIVKVGLGTRRVNIH